MASARFRPRVTASSAGRGAEGQRHLGQLPRPCGQPAPAGGNQEVRRLPGGGCVRHSCLSLPLMCLEVLELCWECPCLLLYSARVADRPGGISNGVWFIKKCSVPAGSHLNQLKVWKAVGVYSQNVEKWVSERPCDQMCNCLLAWKLCLF